MPNIYKSEKKADFLIFPDHDHDNLNHIMSKAIMTNGHEENTSSRFPMTLGPNAQMTKEA